MECVPTKSCQLTLFLLFLLLLAPTICVADDAPGHSKHGSAFDSGMRTRPWVIKGIGDTPFPISTKSPEAQKWFDQGNALLHSFWFEEAERSFRWCLKLEPDNAMTYWSLARCGFNWFTVGVPNYDDKNFERYKAFLSEAVRRKSKVTERERLYIEAWEKAYAPQEKNRAKTMVAALQQIVIRFPDDMEAKSLLALYNIGQGSAFANELLIQQVLAKNPLHPGAHHASIHNWDGVSSDQAIKSCELYGKSAPDIGHAMHMPGHIYSKIGMWHEAAIAMDSATRTELRYMNDRLALPFETWNYPHNRNYLCYIQEQLGMAEASLKGSADMLAAPRDPEYNPENMGAIAGQGLEARVRALIKFEKWDQILAPKGIEWSDKEDYGKLGRAFAEALAFSATGKNFEARERVTSLRALVEKLKTPPVPIPVPAPAPPPSPLDLMADIADGIVSLGEGNVLEGQRKLLNAADLEQKFRDKGEYPNDPPGQAWPVMRLLGDHYRKSGDNKLAIDCYERALKNEPNDGFSLSGLALAHFASGNREQATLYAGRLSYVWSQADPNLKWLEDVRKLGLDAKPVAQTPRPERVYRPKELDIIGPMNWQPFQAPNLKVIDRSGKSVGLQDFKGKNVVLVFFLGDACVHCVGQLKSLNDRSAEFDGQDTIVLAVCSESPAKLKASKALDQSNVKFLSDNAHENARRFSSYDDFEEMELHSTILIDKSGRVRWKRTGGDPFTNIDFLLNELKRVNRPQ
ncbi:redoxin domain-containing protein [Armatimonas sp.]|uniref:redoxin domain-containing protein n=1 Tax=Armatimonas sp. TaxID=1872638 RepID=UPI00375378ED